MWFSHVLALAMGRTVRETLESIDAIEWQMWVEFYNQNPWGEERGDLRNAIVAQTIASSHGAKTKLTDFMPFIDKEQVKQTEEAKVAAVNAIAAAMGVLQGQK